MDYGLTESQRQRHFPEVRSAMASTGNKLLELLEHSLDNEAFPRLALAALITLMASFPSRRRPAGMCAGTHGAMGCARAFVRAGVSYREGRRSRVQLMKAPPRDSEVFNY